MELAKIVSKAIFWYHTTCIDVTNCLGQLHLISDEEWEKRNAHHMMTLVTERYPNATGGRNWFDDMKAIKKEKKS